MTERTVGEQEDERAWWTALESYDFDGPTDLPLPIDNPLVRDLAQALFLAGKAYGQRGCCEQREEVTE